MRILALTPRVFEPANTGGRIRSRRLFEELSRLHDVTLLCLRTAHDTDAHVDAMRRCCTTLMPLEWHEPAPFSAGFYRALAAEFFNPLPHTVLKYRSRALREAVQSALASNSYQLLFCDFLQMSINCAGLPFRPKVLFQHNVEAEIRHGLASYASNRLARAYLSRDAAKLQRYEANMSAEFEHCLMVSEEDCRTMTRLYGAANVTALPSAVDTDYFQPRPPTTNRSCMFLGSMDMLANQDAVTFFVRRILPTIRESMDVTFTVVGRNPPPAIRRLADGIPGVRVTGTVDDVRPHLAEAQLMVVPLRIGGGTRIKIFEAMAMGIPVVSTRLGAAGLPVVDGRDIVLADEPGDFAAAVRRLMSDDASRRQIALAARRLVESGYSWDRVATRVSTLCQGLVARAETVRSTTSDRRDAPIDADC